MLRGMRLFSVRALGARLRARWSEQLILDDPFPGQQTHGDLGDAAATPTAVDHIIMSISLLVSLILCLSCLVAEGRQYSAWRAANVVTRATYAHSWYYISVPVPHLMLLWDWLL
ncbi:hypothetical protein BX600DRAFT_474099 [Xylariales sp. PMI_506]|nr:hypothetical protein BX600DRAFT_474099 [Xylariales sp. PMI_506]